MANAPGSGTAATVLKLMLSRIGPRLPLATGNAVRLRNTPVWLLSAVKLVLSKPPRAGCDKLAENRVTLELASWQVSL